MLPQECFNFVNCDNNLPECLTKKIASVIDVKKNKKKSRDRMVNLWNPDT